MAIDARHPRAIRAEIRAGRLAGPTTGLAVGYAQANLVAVPRSLADDFQAFCDRNSRPCPVLEVIAEGSVEPARMAPGADLRTDLPRYRVFRGGELVEEVVDVRSWWRDDLVAFLLGCSFTFEWGLLEAGVPLRHLEAGRNVAMWRTSTSCESAGPFHGPLVVSMRPIPEQLVSRAIEESGRFPTAHGAPIHVGDPAAIGITDLTRPHYGDPPVIEPGDVPVFWACGVTPQAVALAAKPPFLITHSPGHMFLTDVPCADLRI
jgi:uncharacterized protein YcsI (UPF0317 family)